MIDTTVLHDCQCNLGGAVAPAYGFYRGFIWHRWKRGWVCLIPTEIPTADAGSLMGYTNYSTHTLGSGEEVACIFEIKGLPRAKALIDSFWEKLMNREVQDDQ